MSTTIAPRITNAELAGYCKQVFPDQAAMATLVEDMGFAGVRAHFMKKSMLLALDYLEEGYDEDNGQFDIDDNDLESQFGDSVTDTQIMDALQQLLNALPMTEKLQVIDSEDNTVFASIPTSSWYVFRDRFQGSLPVSCIVYQMYLASATNDTCMLSDLACMLNDPTLDVTQDILARTLLAIENGVGMMLVNGVTVTDQEADRIKTAVRMLKVIIDTNKFQVTPRAQAIAKRVLSGRCDMQFYNVNQESVAHSLRVMCSYFVELPAGLTI